MNSDLTEFQDKKCSAWGIRFIFILQGFWVKLVWINKVQLYREHGEWSGLFSGQCLEAEIAQE